MVCNTDLALMYVYIISKQNNLNWLVLFGNINNYTTNALY